MFSHANATSSPTRASTVWDSGSCSNSPALPRTAAGSALSSSSVRNYRFRANAAPGDYLYRSTVLKWVVPQGAWGILRVH